MSQPAISQLNHDAVLSTEDWTTQQQVLENEIITRFKMASGFPAQAAQLGILDAANPANITSSETGRPLFVKISTQNSLAVAVNPGYAIAPNGALLYVPSFLEIVTLAANPQAGNVYVVVAQSALDTTAGTTQLNDYQVTLSSQHVLSTQVTAIAYTAGWAPLETQVPLAVVSVVTTTSGTILQIDQTQNTYAFNRPWYSVVAIKHESKIGSGTVTDKNPHGTSINDLTIPGTVGIFQGLTGQGLVISQDRLRNKMLGSVICNDTIDYSHIKTDTSGTVTTGSAYNKIGALYALLNRFPLRLGSVFDSATPANAISAEVIPGTNILVFGPNESFLSGQVLSAQYTSCQALNPPTTLTSNFLTFGQPATGEVVVSGGYTYPTIADPTVSLEGTGPFARRYSLYLMQSGTLQAFPQVLVPAQSTQVGILGTFTPVYPARVSVGITNTTGSNSLSVTVTITGTVISEVDSSTAQVTETLIFSPQTGFVDQIVPSTDYDLAGQLLVTQNRFFQITTISAVALNAGPNPQIQVWAEIEPGSCPEMNDAAPVATIFWNGNAVKDIQDDRRIQKIWSPENPTLFAAGESQYDALRMLSAMKPSVVTFTNGATKLITEDFEDLRHFDSLRGYQSPTAATGIIGLNTSIALQPGDHIQLTPSKQITAMTATSSNPVTPGFFDVGTSLSPVPISTIASNIIAAINDTTFASLVTAVQSPSNALNINLTLQSPVGVAANSVTLSASVAISGALALTGFNFGTDGYGECYLDREKQGLQSPVIPDSANLNPYQFAYRKRYRSRALALPTLVGAQTVFFVEVHGEQRNFLDQLRIRGSRYTNPQVWDAWQVMTVATGGTKGLYQITFANPVHKIQVEFYGRARGLSVYVSRP